MTDIREARTSSDLHAKDRVKPSPSYAPQYCAIYPDLAAIARAHGYALAVHGSLIRDFDLVAIPWVDAPSDPQAVVDEITSMFALRQVGGEPDVKPHGRKTWSLSIGHGYCALDLSFMPLFTHKPMQASEGADSATPPCPWECRRWYLDNTYGEWEPCVAEVREANKHDPRYEFRAARATQEPSR